MERERNGGYRPAQSQDSDFIGALAALQRATAKARRRAFDTTGSVAIVKDGRVVWQRESGMLIDEPDRASR